VKIKVVHDCEVPSRSLPSGAVSMTWRWRCPICKQWWGVRNDRGHSVASPIGLKRHLRMKKDV
jgi:hypothetical protein